MNVQVVVDIGEVEEDASLEIIEAAVQKAVQLAMPFHTITVQVEAV